MLVEAEKEKKEEEPMEKTPIQKVFIASEEAGEKSKLIQKIVQEGWRVVQVVDTTIIAERNPVVEGVASTKRTLLD
jgi:hypothetical protein